MAFKQVIAFAVALLVSISFATPWTGPTTTLPKSSLLRPLDASDGDLATFTPTSSAPVSRKKSTRSAIQTTTLDEGEFIAYEIVVKATKTKASSLHDRTTRHVPVKTAKPASSLTTGKRTTFQYEPSKSSKLVYHEFSETSETSDQQTTEMSEPLYHQKSKTSKPSYHQKSETDQTSETSEPSAQTSETSEPSEPQTYEESEPPGPQTAEKSEPSDPQTSETVKLLYQTSETSKAPYDQASETSKPSYNQASSTSKPVYHTSTEQKPTYPTFSWIITSFAAQPTTQAKANPSSSGLDNYAIANSLHLEFLSRMGLLPTLTQSPSSVFTPGPYWPTTSWIIVEAETGSSASSTAETKVKDSKRGLVTRDDTLPSGKNFCRMNPLHCLRKAHSTTANNAEAPTPSGNLLVTRDNPENYPETPIDPLRSYAIWEDWATRQYGYDSEYMNPTNYPMPEPTLQPWTTRSSKHYIVSATIVQPKAPSSTTRRFAKTRLDGSEPTVRPVIIVTERELVDRVTPHHTEPMTYTDSTLRTLASPNSRAAERQLVVPNITELELGASPTELSQARVAERDDAHCTSIDPPDACIKRWGREALTTAPRSVHEIYVHSEVATVSPTHGELVEPDVVALPSADMLGEQQHTPSRRRLKRSILCARFANGQDSKFDSCMQGRDHPNDEDAETTTTKDSENSKNTLFPRQNSVPVHPKPPEDPWHKPVGDRPNPGGGESPKPEYTPKPELKPIKMGPQLGSIFDKGKPIPKEVDFLKGKDPKYLEAEQNEKDRLDALQSCQDKTGNDTIYQACLVDHGMGKPVQVNADPSWSKPRDKLEYWRKCAKKGNFACAVVVYQQKFVDEVNRAGKGWEMRPRKKAEKRGAEMTRFDIVKPICETREREELELYEPCMRRLMDFHQPGGDSQKGDQHQNQHEETEEKTEPTQQREVALKLVDWCYAYHWNPSNEEALARCLHQHGFPQPQVIQTTDKSADNNVPAPPSLSKRQEEGEGELSDYVVAYTTWCQEHFAYIPDKYEDCLAHWGIDRTEVHGEDAPVPKKPPPKKPDELGAP